MKQKRPRLALMAATMAFALVASACGSSDGSAAPKSATSAATITSFTGRVQDTNAFFAIHIDGDEQIAYICDGEKVWSTYEGTLSGDTFTGVNLGGEGTLTATITGKTVAGTVELEDGSSHELRGDTSTGNAGLFRVAEKAAGGVQLASWIRLNNGEVRGKTVVTTANSSGSGEPISGTAGVSSGDGGGGIPPAAANPVPTGLFKCIKAALKRRKATIASVEGSDPELDQLQFIADSEMVKECAL